MLYEILILHNLPTCVSYLQHLETSTNSPLFTISTVFVSNNLKARFCLCQR